MSTPPPGWTPPAVATAARTPAPTGPDLRNEVRKHLDRRRYWSRVIDGLVVMPVTALGAWAWGWNLGTYALFHCLLLIYHHVFEVTSGATLGMRAQRLRVADIDSGALPSPRQAATRGVIAIFEFGLIRSIVVRMNPGRRCVGDYAAGTAIVDASVHPAQPRPLWGGAAVYPAVWALPTAAVCWMGVHGQMPGTYRYQAERICREAQAGIAGKRQYYGEDATLSIIQYEGQRLSALDVPHNWQERHTQLLIMLGGRATLLQNMVGVDAPTVHQELDKMVTTQQPELQRLGYQDCATVGL
jgi:uncharacterized RDD family membrane protein YckC